MKSLSFILVSFSVWTCLAQAQDVPSVISLVGPSVDRNQVEAVLTGTAGPLSYEDMIPETGVTSLNGALQMRFVRPVLNGLLYRGGGKAGAMSALNSQELQALCEAGFSAVDYAYNGQSPVTIRCAGNSFTYRSVPYTVSQAQVFLQDVYNAIQNGSGPVMAHCWNGWHESGLLSAYALRQFCGWSGDEAAAYWQKTIGDTMVPAYYGLIASMRAFKPLASMQISAEQAQVICPTSRPPVAGQ